MAKKKSSAAVAEREPQAEEQKQTAPESLQADAQKPEPHPVQREHILHEQAPQSIGDRIRESRKLLAQPVPTGLKVFEAPDGMVVLGEEEQEVAWYPEGDNGRGLWINPHRTGKEI